MYVLMHYAREMFAISDGPSPSVAIFCTDIFVPFNKIRIDAQPVFAESVFENIVLIIII